MLFNALLAQQLDMPPSPQELAMLVVLLPNNIKLVQPPLISLVLPDAQHALPQQPH
jgi:hypothetical protein